MPLIIGDWQLDNFFHKPIVMEVQKGLQDCYFFYYSTCRKGTNCPFRHEVRALGHERVCIKWSEGQCFELQCPGRHMFIEKRRNNIPCYWESKPNGCLKPHCAFKHRTTRTNENNIEIIDGSAAATTTVSASAAGLINNNTGIINNINPDVVALKQQQQQQQAAAAAAAAAAAVAVGGNVIITTSAVSSQPPPPQQIQSAIS